MVLAGNKRRGKYLLFDEETKSERGASGMHPRSIVGASLEHAGSIHGASSVQLGVAAEGEMFQATSLHTPYGVERMWADVSTWGSCS